MQVTPLCDAVVTTLLQGGVINFDVYVVVSVIIRSIDVECLPTFKSQEKHKRWRKVSKNIDVSELLTYKWDFVVIMYGYT